jgi:hypothetical protein
MTENMFKTLTPIEMTNETETNTTIVRLMKTGLTETQVVWRSSIYLITRGRIIGTHASTKETVISSSNGDSKEWRRIRQDSRSNSGHRTLTHHGHLCLSWSTPVNYVSVVSSSRKFFIQHLRQMHMVSYRHEDRDSEVLREWTLKGLFCQWMMTLNSGHDVSE